MFQRSQHVYAIHIGHEHVEKDYARVTTLSSKKPSFTVAGNENSITQAQQYSGICLRNKLAVINNQNHIVAHTCHRLVLLSRSIERGLNLLCVGTDWLYLRSKGFTKVSGRFYVPNSLRLKIPGLCASCWTRRKLFLTWAGPVQVWKRTLQI